MAGRLPELLARLGSRLPQDRLTELVSVLDIAENPEADILDRFVAANPAAGLAQQLDAMRQTWREEAPTLPGSALALALTATTAVHVSTEEQPVELVVSGPVSSAIPVRLTSGIAVDVIRSAKESLLIASFAAYGVTEVVSELLQAVRRKIHIDLLLEESTAAIRAFGPLGNRVRVWHRTDTFASGTLHAKLIAADRHTALLGSANLTDRALTENIELGVLLHDTRAVGRIVDHFRWLTLPEAGLLRRGP
ncbi:DISARM system phospholipase D-like protein DrmC [Streptomyces hygroscopicus]|uniref:DISARM system phospholipase D-like protein DrmC n=1 Tax=Streptomyces hygroscopicus TaxID=1912 RepID=UPI0038012B40